MEKKKYIVVRKPIKYDNEAPSTVYFVINRDRMMKLIEDYFNTSRRTHVYGAILVFNKLTIGRTPRNFKDACEYCRTLNNRSKLKI